MCKDKFNKFYRDVLNSLRSYSTCTRLKVAAILVKDSRILSSGYNGVAKGKCECNKVFARNTDGTFSLLKNPYLKFEDGHNILEEPEYRKLHHLFADSYEVHAEMNCLGFALRNHTDITGAELYITTSPCLNCCKLIMVSGVKAVYYMDEYDSDTRGIDYLRENGIICEKIED